MPSRKHHMRAAALTLAACLALVAGGCGNDKPAPRFPVTFEVRSDQSPLPGAKILLGAQEIGTTDATGHAALLFNGPDGRVVSLGVRCPEGTRSPTAPVVITLRALQVFDRAAAARGIVQSVNCPPQDRTVAVVVRTDGRVGVPVTWQGQEVTRTNEAGVALMTFHVRPSTTLQVAMHTSDAAPTLTPANPTSQPWVVPDGDDVFVWDQTFQEAGGTRPVRHGGGGGGGGGSVHHSGGGGGGGGGGVHVIHRIQHIGPRRFN
jgi:hypothetical protein